MNIKIGITSENIAEIKDGCIAIAFFEDRLNLNKDIEKLDSALDDAIKNSITNKLFRAQTDEIKTSYLKNQGIKCIALIGLGKEKEFNLNKLMDSVSNLSKKLRAMDIKSFSIYLDSFSNRNFEFNAYLEKIT